MTLFTFVISTLIYYKRAFLKNVDNHNMNGHETTKTVLIFFCAPHTEERIRIKQNPHEIRGEIRMFLLGAFIYQ